ncbi:MAG: hypothetical protein ACK568_19930 [Pseudanabaena sp.]
MSKATFAALLQISLQKAKYSDPKSVVRITGLSFTQPTNQCLREAETTHISFRIAI